MLGIFNKKSKKNLVHDKKLITRLHKDHQKLVELIGKTLAAIESTNVAKTKKYLKKLREAILEHFMQEDIKLYWYLKRYYTPESDTYKRIEAFESSIKKIQREVLGFLGHYSKEETVLDSTFKEKFSTVVQELGARIETEEKNLYPLYLK